MMEAWLLREWQRNSPWQVLLRPLSWIFALLASVRRGLYRTGILASETTGVPVIVVGNISVGGTGKTPLVLAIAQHLARSGWRCGIISRGYARRNVTGKVRRQMAIAIRVVPGSAGSAGASDEALLLATRSGAPVYSSADRGAAARALLDDHPEVDVLLCDDGMQHYALRRDLEICVIDGARGFGNGALLPAGPLRESPARLERVDAIVINAAGTEGALELGRKLPAVPTFSMVLANETLVRVRDDLTWSIEKGLAELSGKRILAIAGTGNPQRFFMHVTGLGFKSVTTRAFPDHHPYTAADFCQDSAEIFLMTEKDAVKCKAFADDRMWFMRVNAILPDAFGEFVVKRLSELKK